MNPVRLLTAALLTSALASVGCDSRTPPDCNQTLSCNNGGGGGGTGGGGGGGGGGLDGGNDGGSTEDGGSDLIEAVKRLKFCDPVRLRGVVVVAVDNAFVGGQGDETTQFWVVDPAHPDRGIYVDKFFKDLPPVLSAAVGDVYDIDGFFGTASKYDAPNGYRYEVKNQHGCQPSTGKLVITKKGTAAVPADNLAPGGFGTSADGGTIKANPELSGTRVHVGGPLHVTNASPLTLRRASADAGDTEFYGFEVTGGILVNDVRTRHANDGGCDWRARVLDGGDVSFPTGISGVWDSYTYAPCYDGGSSCDSHFRDAGYVPGTSEKSTFVLYPQGCPSDFPNADAGY